MLPAGCNTDGISIYENSVYPFPLTNIDPYVTVSNITYVSATETDFTVTIAADAPTEYDAVRIICLSACGIFNEVRLGAYIQPPAPPPPPPCPIPAITAVTPDIWFAGKTYNKVTITGSGFTDTESCPAPQINMYDVDGGQIPFSNVKVTSATEMIAHKVAPPSDTDTETVCVSEGTRVGPQVVSRFASTGASAALASDTAGSPCTDPYGNQGITVQILGAPEIECSGDSMQCNGKVISVIDDGSGTEPTPQNAVVGQQIKLKTKPTADKLTTLGLAFSANTWTAGPAAGPSNNVGGYSQTTSSTKITQTKLTKPDLTTYWLYPQSDNPLTYQYCVNIPGLSATDIAGGLNCSLPADATFKSIGPTATIVPTTTAWHVSRPIPVCNSTGKEQMLIFGRLDPQTSTTCNNVVATSGITFNATVNTLPGSSGQTEWIQVISTNEITGDSVSGALFLINEGTGLDNFLPYNIENPDPVDATTTTTNDSPGNDLGVDEATLTRTFTARMYLMWTSQTSGSIPVPLGYVKWVISGTSVANESNTPPWSLASSTPTSRTFHVSKDTGTKTHGLPTWSSLVTNVNSASADTEQEEEQ